MEAAAAAVGIGIGMRKRGNNYPIHRYWNKSRAVILRISHPAPSLAQSRLYATRAAGNRAITEDAHRSAGVVSSSSAKDTEKMKKDLEQAKQGIARQDARIRELEKSINGDERCTKLEREKHQLRLDLARAKQDADDTKTSHREALALQKKSHEKAFALEKSKHKEEVDSLRRSSAPGIALLEAERLKGFQLAQDEHEQEKRVLRSKHAEDLWREAKHGDSVRRLQAEVDKRDKQLVQLRKEPVVQRQRANEAIKQRNEIRKELDGRHFRAKTDRASYNTYRELFTELDDASYSFLDHMNELMKKLGLEARLWHDSSERFRRSTAFTLVRHNPKWYGVIRSINEFMDEKARQVNSILLETNRLNHEYYSERKLYKNRAHYSRDLTDFWHFSSNEQSDFGTVNMAQYLSGVRPIEERCDELKLAAGKLEEEMKDMPFYSASRQALREELSKTKSMGHAANQWLRYFQLVRAIEGKKALLAGSEVDKAVFVRTSELRELSKTAGAEIAPLNGADQDARLSRLRKMEKDARSQYRKHLERVDSRARGEDGLGSMAAADLTEFDNQLRAEIKHYQHEAELLLASLGLVARVKRTHRERLAVQVSRKALVATATPRKLKSLSGTRVGRVDQSKKMISKTEHKSVEELNLLLKSTERNCQGAKATLHSAIENGSETVNLQLHNHVDNLQEQVLFIRNLIAKKQDSRPEEVDQNYDSDFGEAVKPATAVSRSGGRTRIPPRNSKTSRSLTKFRPTSVKRANLSSPSYDLDAPESTGESPTEVNVQWQTVQDTSREDNTQPPSFFHESTDMQDWGDEPDAETSDASYAASSSAEIEAPVQEKHLNSDFEEQYVHRFNIPDRDYREAVMASPSSVAAFWSHTLYKSPEGDGIRVHYCKSFETAETQLKQILGEPVLGFDLEWEQYAKLETSGIKKNISLVQIAVEDKILLIHIACFHGDQAEQLMPPTLRTIIENPEVIKAGVNVNGDANRLRACFGVQMRGIFELSHLYRLVKFSSTQPKKMNFLPVNLAEQVQTVLLLPLLKSDVRVSAWSRSLNTQQTTYAAADAYAGFRLFHKLDNERKLMRPKPPRPAYFETRSPIIMGDGSVIERSSTRPRTTKKATAGGATTTEEFDEDDEFYEALGEFADSYELQITSAVDESSSKHLGPGSAVAAYPDLSKALSEMSMDKDAVLPHSVDASPPKSPLAAASKATNTVSSSQTELADRWISAYTASAKHSPKLGNSTLRAYHLWHYQNYSLSEVARLCREPPLAITTVASYVMQAIKEEPNLEYDRGRIKEALAVLPRHVWPAYAKIAQDATRG